MVKPKNFEQSIKEKEKNESRESHTEIPSLSYCQCHAGNAIIEMVIAVGNGIGEQSSNPGRSCFGFILCLCPLKRLEFIWSSTSYE